LGERPILHGDVTRLGNTYDSAPEAEADCAQQRKLLAAWARRWFLAEWATELAPSRNAVPTWVEQG